MSKLPLMMYAATLPYDLCAVAVKWKHQMLASKQWRKKGQSIQCWLLSHHFKIHYFCHYFM